MQADIKENIKTPRYWPLWEEFIGDRWIPRTKGQWRIQCFNLMTSLYPSPHMNSGGVTLVTDLQGSLCSKLNGGSTPMMKSCRVISRTRYATVCMMTSSNGNTFLITGSLCGEFTGDRWIPAQSPVTRSFDVFFDLCLNKRLSKQSWGWWFEMPSRSLWRQCTD